MKKKLKVKRVEDTFYTQIRGYEGGYGGFNTGLYEQHTVVRYKVGKKTFKSRSSAYRYARQLSAGKS